MEYWTGPWTGTSRDTRFQQSTSSGLELLSSMITIWLRYPFTNLQGDSKEIIFQELFGREEFSGRKISNFLKENKFEKTGPRGIINTQGDHWMTQRRFSLKTLKDLGFGRKSLENAITTEIDLINEEFLSKEVCIF